MQEAKLRLSCGTTFTGRSNGKRGVGEVVFTTGMTGYVETLTDPSYRGQIVCFTYPLIGNYGVPPKERWESEQVHAAGVVVSEGCENWHHYEGKQSLLQWLDIPVITEVDTRAVTKILREQGVMLGGIDSDAFVDPNERALMEEVAQEELLLDRGHDKTIIAVDCGMKSNILRLLEELPVNIRRVPATYDYSQEPFDALFLSNGPGDPAMAEKTCAILQRAMEKKKPIFGICLGTQLLAMAAGATTYKLPYGHRGHNQPVLEHKTGRCLITSQNHGYAVEKESLSKDWEVTFTNLNDGSVEGIEHKHLPFFAVQFHPEACPGPLDATYLFEKFHKMVVS